MTLLAPDGTGTLRTPTAGARLRANRGAILVGALVLLAALLLALAQSSRTVGLLDPDATDPTGSHALAVLLAGQGVEVVRVTSADAAAAALLREQSATLVIAPTAPLSERMVEQVRTAHPQFTVLLGPGEDLLAAYAPWASMSGFRESTDEVAAGCDWYVASKAGPLPQVGATYSSDRSSVSSCWGGGIVDSGRGGANGAGDEGDDDGVVTLVGMVPGFTNQHLGESGYASMAMGTLGRSHTLVWWLPSAADPLQFDPGTDVSISDLVPTWVGWALLQLVVAVAVVVWWRGRRLGRVVVEPLPVVVRATESVEGRARLYRRGRARESAADALRTASMSRLRARLALPRTAPADVVVAAVSARTARPATEVAALLTPGGAPGDDASLTGLVDALDALENEVRLS
jgi:hypothetical protein